MVRLMQPRLRTSAAAAAGLLLALLAGAGCRTFEVSLNTDAPLRPEWYVAVLPLDDSRAQHIAADHSLYGFTGAQGSGAVVSRCLARAFATQENFHCVGDSAFRTLMHDEKLTIRQIAALDDGQACDLGRKLKADMLVRGEVAVFRTTWFLFVPRSEVQLQIRGIDPSVSRVIWTAMVKDTSHVYSESELVATLSEQVAREVDLRLRVAALQPR